MAKDFFTENNVVFTDHDVAADLEQRKLMVEKTGQMGVPVIVVSAPDKEDEIIIGFDEPVLRHLLNIEG